MQEYSSKISQNIVDKFSKIAKKINKNLSEQPSINEQIKRYEETQDAITGMTMEQIRHENTFSMSPSPIKEKEHPTENKYLVDSYRELVEDELSMKTAMGFFITKLRERNNNELFLLQSNSKEVSSLIRCLDSEIRMILDEYNSMRNAIKEYQAQEKPK